MSRHSRETQFTWGRSRDVVGRPAIRALNEAVNSLYLLSSRRRRRSRERRGAALIELAISILVFLTIVMGTIDLGLGVLRYHQLTEAVRHLARQAAVHGNLATALGPWGPGTISGNAADGSATALILSQRLTSIPAADVSYAVEWIDGGNEIALDHRVRVSASYTYQPMTTFIFGATTLVLQSTTIVHVAH